VVLPFPIFFLFLCFLVGRVRRLQPPPQIGWPHLPDFTGFKVVCLAVDKVAALQDLWKVYTRGDREDGEMT
jgi:hypothetical protein